MLISRANKFKSLYAKVFLSYRFWLAAYVAQSYEIGIIYKDSL